MAGDFGPESANDLRVTQVITSVPFTYACWGYLTDVSNPFKTLIAQGEGVVGGSVSRREWLYVDPAPAGDPVTYQSRGPGADATLVSSISTVINAWTHFAATDSGTAQEIFNDGVSGGTSSVTVGPRTKDETLIGAAPNGSAGLRNWWAGRIAEAAIWDRILAAAEIAALAAGYSPLFFRRGLRMYQSLIRDLTNHPGIGPAFTNTGVVVIEHLPIIYPATDEILMWPPSGNGNGNGNGEPPVSVGGPGGGRRPILRRRRREED